MAYFNNVDSVKQYPLCRGNQRVKQERKRKSGQGLVMTIFGTTDVSYVTLQIRETHKCLDVIQERKKLSCHLIRDIKYTVHL